MTITAPAHTLTDEQEKGILLELKFRVTGAASLTAARRTFQDAYRLTGERLAVDGVRGPRTTAALLLTETRRRAGQTTLSPHFSWAEFACRCAGLPGCLGQLVHGVLVDAAETIRAAHYRDGLFVVSGYRCPAHNGDTPGAASGSQHPYGGGLDLNQRVKPAAIAKLGVVSGIGFSPSTGLVKHVDVRGIPSVAAGMSRTTPPADGGTRARPSVFPDGE